MAHVSKNSGNNEWYTPPNILEMVRDCLGTIDLDPASCEIANQNVKANSFFSIENDALTKEWYGKVFMNPPYSKDLLPLFAQHFVIEYEMGNITKGIVLVNNATETKWFQMLMGKAKALCLIRGRVKFLSYDGVKKPPCKDKF